MQNPETVAKDLKMKSTLSVLIFVSSVCFFHNENYNPAHPIKNTCSKDGIANTLLLNHRKKQLNKLNWEHEWASTADRLDRKHADSKLK